VDWLSHQLNRLSDWDAFGQQFSLDEGSSLDSFGPCVHARFIPVHYEPNYAYPLIIWLHGCGGCERDLWKMMPLISNYVAIAPYGFPIEANVAGWPETSEGISYAQYAVDECIEYAQDHFNVATNKVFVAGMDDGGTMAVRLGLLNPEKFAGALSVGGGVPRGHAPLRNLKRARRQEVWLGECVNEDPVYESCADVLRLFHSAGISVVLRHYLGESGVYAKLFSDMNCWIMDRVTGQVDNARLSTH